MKKLLLDGISKQTTNKLSNHKLISNLSDMSLFTRTKLILVISLNFFIFFGSFGGISRFALRVLLFFILLKIRVKVIFFFLVFMLILGQVYPAGLEKELIYAPQGLEIS